MTNRHRSRRAFGATLLLAAILTLVPVATASAGGGEGSTILRSRSRQVPDWVCDIRWQKGPRAVKRLIRCAARRWNVNTSRALFVANRESNFRPRAFNSSSCAKGIYQHLCRYWPGRADYYGMDGESAFDARANIIVSVRMVRRYGWGPWGF